MLAEIKHPSVEGFYAYCQERESIRLRKEVCKHSPPWTEDKVLQRQHFCNVRRADDYGSRWYIQKVVPAAQSFEDLLWRTVIYRMVNNVDYFERLEKKLEGKDIGVFGIESWNQFDRRVSMRTAIESNGTPFTPAHIVLQGNDTKNRIEHFLQGLEILWENLHELEYSVQHCETLQEAWKRFQVVDFVGPFISLQIVRDLVMSGTKQWDENAWCYLGPGAVEGIEMIMSQHREEKEEKIRKGIPSQRKKERQAFMRKLYRDQPPELLEVLQYKPLSLADVEHCLCEYNKLVKQYNNKGRKRLYHPHKIAI